jgi:hypothetical protein
VTGPLKDDTPITVWLRCLDNIGTPCSSPHVSHAALRSLISAKLVKGRHEGVVEKGRIQGLATPGPGECEGVSVAHPTLSKFKSKTGVEGRQGSRRTGLIHSIVVIKFGRKVTSVAIICINGR